MSKQLVKLSNDIYSHDILHNTITCINKQVGIKNLSNLFEKYFQCDFFDAVV
jgi:hypothetical protein